MSDGAHRRTVVALFRVFEPAIQSSRSGIPSSGEVRVSDPSDKVLWKFDVYPVNQSVHGLLRAAYGFANSPHAQAFK